MLNATGANWASVIAETKLLFRSCISSLLIVTPRSITFRWEETGKLIGGILRVQKQQRKYTKSTKEREMEVYVSWRESKLPRLNNDDGEFSFGDGMRQLGSAGLCVFFHSDHCMCNKHCTGIIHCCIIRVLLIRPP